MSKQRYSDDGSRRFRTSDEIKIDQLREENKRLRESVCWLLQLGVGRLSERDAKTYRDICELVDFEWKVRE